MCLSWVLLVKSGFGTGACQISSKFNVKDEIESNQLLNINIFNDIYIYMYIIFIFLNPLKPIQISIQSPNIKFMFFF